MLGMCSRELLGNDLRRAVRDLICDENFDDGIATCLRLDFEILVSLALQIIKTGFEEAVKNSGRRNPCTLYIYIYTNTYIEGVCKN